MSGRRLYNVSTILAVSSVTSCLVLSLLLLLYGPLTFFNEWSVSESLGFISNVSFCKIPGFTSLSGLVVWSLNLNISGLLLKVAFISNLSDPSNVGKVSSTFESEIPFNCRSSAIARKLSMLDWNAHCLLFDNFSSNSKNINIQTKLPAGPLPRQSIYEVHQSLKIFTLHPPHEDYWVTLLRSSLKHCFEERAACREDQLVSLELLILAHQSDIGEVALSSQPPKVCADVALEVRPLYRQFFIHVYATIKRRCCSLNFGGRVAIQKKFLIRAKLQRSTPILMTMNKLELVNWTQVWTSLKTILKLKHVNETHSQLS